MSYDHTKLFRPDYSRYAFGYNLFCKDIEAAFIKSIPKRVDEIKFTKIKADFDTGEFKIFIKNPDNIEFYIPFIHQVCSINNLWIFLEDLALTKVPLVFSIYRNKAETIIYTCSVSKEKIRFLVFNTLIYQNNKNLGKYTYANADIDMDIIIDKKHFIWQFYKVLRYLFEFYENIAYFEPPVTDFSIWTKDSQDIRKYLKRNLVKKKYRNPPEIIYPILQK